MGLNGPENKQEKGEDLRVCGYSSPRSSSAFVLRDRGALFFRGEGATKALKCTQVQDNAALKGKSMVSCVLPGQCWALGQPGWGRGGTAQEQGQGQQWEAEGEKPGCKLGTFIVESPCPIPSWSPSLWKLFCLRIPK